MLLLEILKGLFVKDDLIFKDGHTTFLLSSEESQKFKGSFKCSLIKTVYNHKTKGYLVKINNEVFGDDFYILVPKYIGLFFGRKKINDVYILQPSDVESIKLSAKFSDTSVIIAWGHIYDIQT